MFQYTMRMFVHLTHLVLSYGTLLYEIFSGSFLFKNHVVFCVPTTKAKCILFFNHRKKKVVGGNQNVLVHSVDVCAPDPSGVVLCNPFSGSFLIKNLVIFVCLP